MPYQRRVQPFPRRTQQPEQLPGMASTNPIARVLRTPEAEVITYEGDPITYEGDPITIDGE